MFQLIPISEHNLYQRVARKVRIAGKKLVTDRARGGFVITNLDGEILSEFANIEEVGRAVDCIRPWEKVAEA